MIVSTTDTIYGYKITSYCGVYTYRDYGCNPNDAIAGIMENFRDDYPDYDEDNLALVGVRLTQLSNWEDDNDAPSFLFVAYGTGVIVE